MKIPAKVKAKITKMFKAGCCISEIIASAAIDFPRITATEANRIIGKHLFWLADALWSKVIRSKGRCEVSGSAWSLEAHHLIKRDNLLFRWDSNNGLCLCAAVHFQVENGLADIAEWLEKNKPDQWRWYENHKDVQNINKVSNEELLGICNRLTQCLKEKKNDQIKANCSQRSRVTTATFKV